MEVLRWVYFGDLELGLEGGERLVGLKRGGEREFQAELERGHKNRNEHSGGGWGH